MESKYALSQLSALAQENRLAVFRLLVSAGHDGLAAGQIATSLGVAPNTLSAQLTLLSNAELITSERRGRSIVYAVNYKAISKLIVFLMADCCQGHRDVCVPVAEAARNACCGIHFEKE